MRFFSGFLFLSLLITAACTSSKPELKTGIWRGEVEMQGLTLPFNFEVSQQTANNAFTISLINGTEKILLDEIEFFDDSIRIVMHIFDSELRAKIADGELNGYFIKNYAIGYKIPFNAKAGESHRFTKKEEQSSVNFSGKYAVEFLHEKDTVRDVAVAVGIFDQQGNQATGTFLLNSGDYRFLQGNIVEDELWLSTFDGNHSFIFRAKKNGDTLVGDFWSGMTWHETWTGIEDDNAAMPKNETLTFLKEGYDKIDFSFPDLNGKLVTPGDDRFKNKVLILQIFGTWCPNCMDETKFLANWYKENKERGVEILGLAYERKADVEYAKQRVQKMKDKLDVDYDFVIAGTDDKVKAAETLPMLNHVIAFPTTIFIGKDGNVKYIHTGFTGPGTGVYYDQFREWFNQTTNELLQADLTSQK